MSVDGPQHGAPPAAPPPGTAPSEPTPSETPPSTKSVPSVDPAPRPSSRAPLTGDWPAQAADTVVDVVGSVRERVIEPLLKIARVVVYGLLISVAALVALVLLLIALVRMLDSYLPGEVWSAYLLLGGLFTIGGVFCWSQRSSKAA